MNFFCDSGGNIFHVDPENVYQGSANANTIYFIGAFASSCQVTVAFGLPNGVYTEPTLLTLVTDSETLSVNDKNGVKFNVWQVRLNGVVTENYGKVDLQFYVYGNGGNGQGACIASAYSSFEVSKGVPITLPDDTNYPEESLLAQILAQLQRLQAQAAASTEAIEENTEAIVEVQKALEDKIKEFNGDLSGKVDKLGAGYYLYAKDTSGKDIAVEYWTQPNPLSVPYRTANGCVQTGSPVEKLDSTNKEYLDSADARLQAEANGEVTIATIEINNPNTTLAFKNLEGMTEIDWGDGTINSELTHTYEKLGVYYCRIYGLVSIGEEAFKGSIPSNHTPITHIKISNKVTSIGDNAFTYTKLRSIEIPNSVTYIGSSFDSSFYLEKIVIPESVTYIDVGAFNMCANLKIVELKGAPPQQIYSGDIFSLADKLEKIIVPYGMVEAYKSASAWTDYATLIDCLVYQSDLDVSEEKITEKITENREEINKDIKNLYAITAQGGLYTILEVEQAFSSRETADGENIVDGQYTAPTKIQGDTVACKNLFDISKVTNTSSLTNNGEALTVTAASPTSETLKELCPTLKAGDVLVMSFNTTSDVNFIMFTSLIRSWTNGQSITIDENMLNDTLTFYHNISSGESAVISNIQIEYGTTATDYQPYFTGLKNAHFKGIKSTGKNLFNSERELSSFSATLNTSLRDFDETKVYVGMSNNNYVNLSAITNVSYIDGIFSFTTTNNAGYGVGVPIKVKPDTQYSVSYRLITGSNVILGIGFYNKNGALIEYSYSRKTFTTSIDCAWVLLVISNNLAGSISYTDIQLEESSVATAYEPYKEDIYELPEAVELAFGDTLDVENEKIINNGYTEVINIADKVCVQAGTAWQREGFFCFYAIDALSKTGKLGAPHRITAICTNGFSQGGWQFDANTFENGTERYILTGNNSNTLYVIMPNSDLGVTQEDTGEVKIAAAKEWFANNPTTVRYITVDTMETSTETPERYQAWKNGSETVAQGDTDNSEYGAMPTVTTEYFKLTEV